MDSRAAVARGGMGAEVERPETAPRRLGAGGAPKRGGAVGLSTTHVECVSRQITGGVQRDPLCIPCHPLSRSELENRPGSESRTASTPPRFDSRILHARHVKNQVRSGSRSTSILLSFDLCIPKASLAGPPSQNKDPSDKPGLEILDPSRQRGRHHQNLSTLPY